MSDEFLTERQDLLENYLQRMSRLPGIQNVDAFVTFVTSTETPPPSSSVQLASRSVGRGAWGVRPAERHQRLQTR